MPSEIPVQTDQASTGADVRLLLQGCGRPLAGAVALALASSAFDILCMAALPVFLLYALSAGAELRLPEVIVEAVGRPSPLALALGIALLFLLRGAFALLVGAQLAARAQAVRARLVSRLAQSYAGAAFERAVTRPVADGVTAAAVHTHYFAENGVLALMRLALDLFTVIAVLAFLFVIEPRFVLGTLAVLAGVGTASYALVRRANDRHAARQTALEDRLAQQVAELLNAPREVRILGLGRYLGEGIDTTLREMVRIRAWFGTVYWVPRVLGELTLIGLAIAYLLGRATAGEAAAEVVSGLGVFAYAGVRLLPAFAQTLASLSTLRAALPGARRLASLLAEPPASPGPNAPPDSAAPLQRIELQDICFRYAGAAQPALDGVSLRLEAGQSLGLIGPSGSGKSTLADVIMGLLVPQSGELRVNGRPATLANPAWWKRVGFVAQVPFITNDTLRRNITFGMPDASVDEHRLAWAVRMAQLEPLVQSLPGGLDTPLGERGGALSGGQRQRVALARALYRRCELLILDEATSALDPETERLVAEAIGQLRGSVTLIVIAHRPSLLAGCDQILRVSAGRVGQAGASDLSAPG